MLIGSLQENLLTILAFDPERAPIVRAVIDSALFGGPYRLIAARIYDYLDTFKKPPGDHLPDLLSDKLEGRTSDAGYYTEIIDSLYVSREHINPAYVMTSLETFVKRQSLRTITVDLQKALQRDTEEGIEEAEKLIAGANHVSLKVFDPGTRLSDKKKALAFLELTDDSFPTGIKELDDRGFGPTRKELWLFIGNAKAGKTWALGQLAKSALRHRYRVLHISLEMSEKRASQRYFQSLFAMAKRKDSFEVTRFQRDSLNRISGFDTLKAKPALSMDDPHIRKKLERRIDRWSTRLLDNIIIKEFPSGHLTVLQLRVYLDNLETSEKFVPDLLIVDYPDLLKLDKDNYRLDLDDAFKELRGLAVSRNFALAAVSQSHRSAAKAKQVGVENVAEAYSKIAHSDVVLTYTQTPAENKLGLARLHVAAGRNDKDKFTVVISQAYNTGQFIVDSSLMKGTYWQNLPVGEGEP
jgi:replicative DNA helicase